jgi:hypothetical protein
MAQAYLVGYGDVVWRLGWILDFGRQASWFIWFIGSVICGLHTPPSNLLQGEADPSPRTSLIVGHRCICYPVFVIFAVDGGGCKLRSNCSSPLRLSVVATSSPLRCSLRFQIGRSSSYCATIKPPTLTHVAVPAFSCWFGSQALERGFATSLAPSRFLEGSMATSAIQAAGAEQPHSTAQLSFIQMEHNRTIFELRAEVGGVAPPPAARQSLI